MKFKDKTKTDHRSPLDSIPKWLMPIMVILVVAVIYFIAQYLSSIILSLYALMRGWSVAYANNWLSNSIPAQFFYIVIFESATIGLLYLLLRRYKRSLKDIGLKKPRLRDGGYGIIAYPAYLIIYLVLFTIIRHFYAAIQVNQTQQIGFNSVHGNFDLALTFISLVILPPIAEELLFRGFLFEGLKKSMHWVYAGILTSVIFASAHLPEGGSSGLFWIGAIDVFSLSLVLVFLKQKTKSLWPGIILHSLKNLIAFISLFVLTNR